MNFTNIFGDKKSVPELCGWTPDKNGLEYRENIPVGDMIYSCNSSIIRIRNFNGSHTSIPKVIMNIPDIGDTLLNKKFDNIKIHKEQGIIVLDYTTNNNNKLVLFINHENYKKLQQWKKSFEVATKLLSEKITKDFV